MGEVKPEPNKQPEVTSERGYHWPDLVITGANGFVGRACVAEARRRGLGVLALFRSAPELAWANDPEIQSLKVDLSDPDTLVQLQDLPKSVAWIHAAGHMGADPADLALDMVAATANLPLRADQRFVLISSLSVYDTDLLHPNDTLTEDSALLAMPETGPTQVAQVLGAATSPYAMAKRVQETVIPQQADLAACWILRPGAIWGPGRSWHALMGFWASKLHVTIGSDGELPLVHVDHVARSAIDAARSQAKGAQVVNLFDDDRPTRARFLAAHRRCYGWPKLNITISYSVWRSLVRAVRPIAPRLPGLFREPVLRARMMPLRYPNTQLRSLLGGEDIDTFEAMMARTCEAER